MDLGPAQPVRECPTCGVDAARAMIVSACVAYYAPDWHCPRCPFYCKGLQRAADHLAEHEPDILEYVREWASENGASYRLVREEP